MDNFMGLLGYSAAYIVAIGGVVLSIVILVTLFKKLTRREK